MPLKSSRAPRLLSLPSRQWASRASLIMLSTAAVSLVIMSQTGNPAASRVRTAITDVVAPIVAIASAPVDAVAAAGNWVSDMASLRSDNIALKNANVQLLQWQSMAKDMEAENRSLRAMLNVIPSKKNHYITARIVSDMGGPYVRSALIGGGLESGIKKDQAVINERGLVGRVVEAGENSARVLLLSDINSRIPVVAETSGEKIILVGNNNNLPTLSYLTPNSQIQVGERIVTSGDGGVFPRGLAVGVVTAVDKGAVRVQPFVDTNNIEYVSVVDYSL